MKFNPKYKLLRNFIVDMALNSTKQGEPPEKIYGAAYSVIMALYSHCAITTDDAKKIFADVELAIKAPSAIQQTELLLV